MNENLPTVTLSQAKSIIQSLAHEQSVLLLSAPGVGKSDIVNQAAHETALPCRSLLGTQIAPEDVSGIPRIVGERSVFCPPRILLPEEPEPFCLFLDELPACTPDIQKAFYSLLLERRLGEHPLPKGTWVVAAGNRVEDRSLVRSLSAALVNRVIILNVRVDVKEWLIWAHKAGVRQEIMSYIAFMNEALMRPIPATPAPFSTPRSWVSLSKSLQLAEASGILTPEISKSLVFGSVSPEDAATFSVFLDGKIENLRPWHEYLLDPLLISDDMTQRWFVLHQIRSGVVQGLQGTPVTAEHVNAFLRYLSPEERASVLLGIVPAWGNIGADAAILDTLKEITGIA